MRDWLKILLAVGGGAAVALVIALPIVLTEDEAPSVPEDPGAQRFPDYNFVKYEELLDGKLSYKRFSNGFSVVTPDMYICTVDGTYYKRPVEGYAVGSTDYDKCDNEKAVKITGEKFAEWREEHKFTSCSLSKDELYVMCYNNYMKQWRHSFYADYYVWDVVGDKVQFGKTDTGMDILAQAQYCGWSPTGHNLVCVSSNKDIYLWADIDLASASKPQQVTTTGGWCMDSHRIMDVVYTQENGKNKCIFNGVPDWNYEEEMISTTNTIYWASDSSKFAFVSFDVSNIHELQYSVYPEHLAAGSSDEVDKDSFEQYPRMNQILYAKTEGKISETHLWVHTLGGDTKEINSVGADKSLTFDQGVGTCTGPDCEVESSQENRYFTKLAWSPDNSWFLSVWSSRDATQSKGFACKSSGVNWDCEHSGTETGGVSGHWDKTNPDNWQWVDEEGSNGAGWVGSFGPFQPVLTDQFGTYYTIFSKKTSDSGKHLHAYNMTTVDGYWNVAKVEIGKNNVWLTDSVTDKWVVTDLEFLEGDKLYFTAARGKNVGDFKATEQRKRHVFSIDTAVSGAKEQCLTCDLDTESGSGLSGYQPGSCQWVSIRRNCASCEYKMFFVQCSGPDYPKTVMATSLDGNWKVMEDNSALKAEQEQAKLMKTKVIFGIWENEDYGTFHNYEMFVPHDFDEKAIDKKYPVFLEVYAGPEFQKVQGTYKQSWPQSHLPSAYDCITLSVDGRGSAFQGDAFMFANYKALGQTERVDQTEFIRWFINKGPYASIVDKTRVSVYGWSYGGYTTTNIMGYGGGDRGLVFMSGVAVAPLADWRFYDAMYAERYMGFNGEKDTILEPHWVNASMIERNMNENHMANFGKAEYHLIHGNNDDNVHFLSAAQMEKALVSQGIDFDNFFYADEDHSIRSTKTVNKHVYRNIITRIVESWGYKWNGDGNASA